MDSIVKAVQRARELPQTTPLPAGPWRTGGGLEQTIHKPEIPGKRPSAQDQQGSIEPTIQLDEALLRSHRIVGFDTDASPNRHYDLLRDQIVHDHQPPGALIIAVTAAASGNGTTVTAANLAFTFARNPAHRVALVSKGRGRDDALYHYLGLVEQDAHSHIWSGHERSGFNVSVVNVQLWLASPAASHHIDIQGLINGARTPRHKPATVIIIDLPPLPASDVAMCYIGLSTNVVVVLAAGETGQSEVESCTSVLGRRKGVHYILNKSGRHGL